MSNYHKLNVWHKAVELAVGVYTLTDNESLFKNDFGLRDQIRRSAVSIPSNISEGDELGTDKQAIRQFYIAKGSSAELYTQILISLKIGYLNETDSKYYLNECQTISSMLANLIKSRKKTNQRD